MAEEQGMDLGLTAVDVCPMEVPREPGRIEVLVDRIDGVLGRIGESAVVNSLAQVIGPKAPTRSNLDWLRTPPDQRPVDPPRPRSSKLF